MFRFIQLYILKVRLARIVRAAELAVEKGILQGDKVYTNLYLQALKYSDEFTAKYPGFDVHTDIPAIEDLRKLTNAEVSPDTTKLLIIYGIRAVGTVVVIGLVSAAIAESYHCWIHLFHWIGV